MVKIARSIRHACHRRMLQLDEALCRHVLSPPDYDLPASEIGERTRQFLTICASGRVSLIYETGMRVPRSLFYSRHAVLLLSPDPATRQAVRTPYGFASRAEMLVPGGYVESP